MTHIQLLIFSTLTLLLLLLLPIIGTTQIMLSGQILNEEEAIEFANIYLQHMEKTEIEIGHISDENGQFQIEIPEKGNYILTVSFIGYTDWIETLTVVESVDLGKIVINTQSNELEEVVVTAERKIIEKKDNKLVFNVAQSPLKTGFDGMEVLQRSPNVLVDQNGNILMRNEAATVMINGRISNLDGADLATYLSNINSDDIKSVEVQTHLSANIKGESSGGVVNIILKKKAVGFAANLRSEYTIRPQDDFGVYSGFNFDYGAEKWNVYGGYNYVHNTFLTKHDSDITYFNTDNYLAEQGAWGWERSVHNYRLGFVAQAADNQMFGIEGFATNNSHNMENNNFLQIYQLDDLLDNGKADLIGGSNNDLYNLTANYTWTIDTLNSNLKIFADFSTQDLSNNNQAFSTYEVGFYEDNTERNNNTANTNIYSLQADIEKHLVQNIKLQIGSKWTYTDRNNDLLSEFLNNDIWQSNSRSNAFRYTEQVTAGYFTLSKRFKEKNYLELGLRVENTQLERVDRLEVDKITQNYTDWLPNIYFARDFSNDNRLSMSYSKRLRRPPFFRINNNVIKVTDFRFELGNPNLTPEYVHRLEGNFEQKKQTFSAYYIKTNDAINGVYFLEGEAAYYKPFNAGSQSQFGVTYNRFGNLTKWWFIKADLGVYRRKFTNEAGEDSFARTSSYVRMTNNFKINATTSIELSGRFTSPLEDAFYIAYEYYNVDLMLQKSFWNKKLNCKIYINDIFNLLEYRNKRPFDDFVSTRVVKPQTRTLRLWLTYNIANKNKLNKRANQSKNDARRRL